MEADSWINKFLGTKDEIASLRIDREKDLIRNEYEARIREMEAQHKKELADRENRWEERIMGITSTIAPDLLKGFMGGKPIAGFPETETETEKPMTNTPDQQKKRVIDAVNKLMLLDSNLAENLERLAKMAQSSPDMYKQAVNILKTMS
jgi:hypothetical protein